MRSNVLKKNDAYIEFAKTKIEKKNKHMQHSHVI